MFEGGEEIFSNPALFACSLVERQHRYKAGLKRIQCME
jgi:hypothetical protein